MGYHRAGFHVVGVDISPQPRYPFEFHQADALTFPLDGFDAIHASPPCQGYCRMKGLIQSQGHSKDHPLLIEATRQALISEGKPYVIENVPGSPLINPIQLCGSSFALLVQRHRFFESSIWFLAPPCCHAWQTSDKPALHRHQGVTSRVVGCYGNGRGQGDNLALWSKAMGIDWMTRRELAQAIPPAYTQFIGKQLINHL